MAGVLIFNLIAVLFAWLESSGRFKHGLKFSILTVFLFLALRYDYGNDYMSYLNYFVKVNSESHLNPEIVRIKGNEIGWLYLNRFFGLFGQSGFIAMTIVLAAFSSYVLFRFIKMHVPPQYYWFAIFFYVFNFETMLILCSAMRQAVAISLFLLAFEFIYKKNILKYLVLIYIGTLFHSSAAFLFPLFLLGYRNFRINNKHIVVVIAIFVGFVVFNKELYNLFFQFTSQSKQFDFYSVYTRDVKFLSVGIGFAINLLIYTIVMVVSKKVENEEKFIYPKIVMISLLIIPLSLLTPLITRLNYYLLPIMVVVFPIAFNQIKYLTVRRSFLFLVVLFTLYTFVAFFESPVHGPYYKEYKTIFSSSFLLEKL